jgi:hypothetical protein
MFRSIFQLPRPLPDEFAAFVPKSTFHRWLFLPEGDRSPRVILNRCAVVA